jgi:hypothetical protein
MRKPILKKQIDWSFASVVLATIVAIISAIGWGVSVEVRFAQQASLKTIQESVDALASSVSALNSRTQNIEKLLLPVIVDYRVRKEVEEKLSKALPAPYIRSPAPPDLLDPNGSPSITPDVQQTPKMVSDAEKWAKEQIQKGQQVP